PQGLTPGVYQGSIVVTGFGGSGPAQTVSVTLAVTSPAPPAVTNLLNAASLIPGPVAPGEIVTLQGSGLGPTPGVSGTITAAGAFATSAAGIQVLFDGVPAPLLYVSGSQINAVVPYEVFNRSTTNIQVSAMGVTSATLSLGVNPSAPGIFTASGSGSGPGAILNQDGSLNSVSNPASLGSIVSIYATGEGQTSPAGQDGRIIATDVRKPLLPVTVLIGGVPATSVQYAGSAPGLVSGTIQVNVLLDDTIGKGSAVPVQIQVGSAVSPGAVTVAVQ
ncbi:MAG: IPT/TIG domain-containing protein, partial [Streptosporangiaceae bacterium]